MGMLDQRAKDLIAQGDGLFTKRTSLLSLWQTIADNFYVERADFTAVRTVGEEFAAGLYSSYPLIVRRELGNSFSSMLRRKDQEWFKVSVDHPERLDNAGREWLEWATGVQRRAMYDRASQFVRATKEGDQDYAAFGQCAISEEINWRKTSLLYRCWHLRDLAWCEAEDGTISDRHLNVKPQARWLANMFGKDKLHPNVVKMLEKEPYREIPCRRVIIPAADYDFNTRGSQGGARFPWMSMYVDVENQHLMDERPSRTPVIVIPRWQTVSGSQYS